MIVIHHNPEEHCPHSERFEHLSNSETEQNDVMRPVPTLSLSGLYLLPWLISTQNYSFNYCHHIHFKTEPSIFKFPAIFATLSHNLWVALYRTDTVLFYEMEIQMEFIHRSHGNGRWNSFFLLAVCNSSTRFPRECYLISTILTNARTEMNGNTYST